MINCKNEAENNCKESGTKCSDVTCMLSLCISTCAEKQNYNVTRNKLQYNTNTKLSALHIFIFIYMNSTCIGNAYILWH